MPIAFSLHFIIVFMSELLTWWCSADAFNVLLDSGRTYCVLSRDPFCSFCSVKVEKGIKRGRSESDIVQTYVNVLIYVLRVVRCAGRICSCMHTCVRASNQQCDILNISLLKICVKMKCWWWCLAHIWNEIYTHSFPWCRGPSDVFFAEWAHSWMFKTNDF